MFYILSIFLDAFYVPRPPPTTHLKAKVIRDERKRKKNHPEAWKELQIAWSAFEEPFRRMSFLFFLSWGMCRHDYGSGAMLDWFGWPVRRTYREEEIN